MFVPAGAAAAKTNVKAMEAVFTRTAILVIVGGSDRRDLTFNNLTRLLRRRLNGGIISSEQSYEEKDVAGDDDWDEKRRQQAQWKFRQSLH